MEELLQTIVDQNEKILEALERIIDNLESSDEIKHSVLTITHELDSSKRTSATSQIINALEWHSPSSTDTSVRRILDFQTVLG